MVLKGQNHRIIGCDKGAVAYSVNDIFEQDFRAHGPSVGDYGFVIGVFTIPAVQFNAPKKDEKALL